MGRNEIRLRRQFMSAGRIARHRNYGELMARHERDMKIRRFAKLFTFFLLILFLLIVFAIVVRWENRQKQKMDKKTSYTTYFSNAPDA